MAMQKVRGGAGWRDRQTDTQTQQPYSQEYKHWALPYKEQIQKPDPNQYKSLS